MPIELSVLIYGGIVCVPLSLVSYFTDTTRPDSIEQQAFGRVFRIGQHKETHVSRLVVKNSIDMRLLSMQADKVRTIDRAMQDTDAAIVEPLSITDLAGLFGHLREYVELARFPLLL